MAKNKLTDLRDHLFATIERLNEAEDPTKEIERAKAIVGVSNAIISAAKLEADFLVKTDQAKICKSAFIEPEPKALPAPPRPIQAKTTITQQRGLSTGKDLGTRIA